VLGENFAAANPTPFVGRRHHGKWQRIKPGVGRGGSVDGIAAGSSKVVWAVGMTASQAPYIGRWHGTAFRAVSIAGLPTGAEGEFDTVVASSATNAWAVGDGDVAHWNGKTWSLVSVPTGLSGAIATTGRSNAWAVDRNGDLEHWNGKVWAVRATPPGSAVTWTSMSSSSVKRVVLVGYVQTTSAFDTPIYKTYVERFTGKKWVRVRAGLPHKAGFSGVTMHGTSAWAVGIIETSDNSKLVIAHSTGGKWKTQRAPRSMVGFGNVSAESAKQVYAAGGCLANGAPVTSEGSCLAAYNGHRWTAEPVKL
jgi:hypothetical protein